MKSFRHFWRFDLDDKEGNEYGIMDRKPLSLSKGKKEAKSEERMTKAFDGVNKATIF